MKPKPLISRRTAIKGLGTLGASAIGLGTVQAEVGGNTSRMRQPALRRGDIRETLLQRVMATPLVDTHEHLIEEAERLQGAAHPRVPCDDWTMLFSHYLDSDLRVAGMANEKMKQFLSPQVEPRDKWKLLAPYWPAVKHTGYALAVRLAMRELYGVEELSATTIRKVQAGYEQTRKPGFYRRILQELAGIESCQVNCLTGEPFKESAQPTLLMQDLSILGMFAGPKIKTYAAPAKIEVTALADWHRVMDWWFERYGSYAVAVKSQNAYSRDIDYERVAADVAEPIFEKVLRREPLSGQETKSLEDHLFWEAVSRATAHELPVKLHTGYYAGQNYMPLARLRNNAGSATDLCRESPETKFVFMHICYPYYEDILAVAKHYTNAFVDMCWSWIINPIAAKDYLKKHLLTAPANKLLPFGGDYIPVEPVLGHALIARRGIAQALTELVEEGWLSLDDALELVEPLLCGNARQLFQLKKRTATLQRAEWRQ